jgi:hypothetical protein
MNDFFDKLGSAAKRAANNVANEVSIAAEKQRLSDAYRDLGKLCYQALKQNEIPNFPADVAKIDGLLQRIAELKDRRDVTNVQTEPSAPPAPAPEADEPDFILVNEGE